MALSRLKLTSPSTIAKIEVPAEETIPNNQLFHQSYEFYLIGLGLLFLLWMNFFNKESSKGKLATSYWAGSVEINNNEKAGKDQIKNLRRDYCSLYINPNKEIIKQKNLALAQKKIKPIKHDGTKTIYLTDASRGTAILGGAGTGKTFGGIDPMAQSAVDQGIPIILYDVKYPTQSKRIAAYAAKHGYKVRIFAPGFLESDNCNILDFIEDETDKIGASQIGKTIIKNASSTKGGKGDPFFDDAAESFTAGIFLIVKAIPRMLAESFPSKYRDANGEPNELAQSYADVITCQSLLSLPDLAERLSQAKENQQIDTFAGIAISQVLSVKDSEKTVAGILGTTQKTFMKFIERKFVNTFTGKTNIPLELDNKELLIFGMDRNNRDVVAPLLSAIIDMIVSRNVMRPVPRKKPLACFFDEVVTLYLPRLQNWLAENREDGFVGVLGYQNQGQMIQMYGKEAADIIFGNCGTKIIFNPQEIASAELISKMLGDEQIKYSTKSSSTSKGGGSKSQNQNLSKKQLLEPAQLMKLGKGKAIFINPNFKNRKESYVPFKTQIKVSETVLKEKAWSQSKWPNLIDFYKEQFNRYSAPSSEEIRAKIKERERIVGMLFPLQEKKAA